MGEQHRQERVKCFWGAGVDNTQDVVQLGGLKVITDSYLLIPRPVLLFHGNPGGKWSAAHDITTQRHRMRYPPRCGPVNSSIPARAASGSISLPLNTFDHQTIPRRDTCQPLINGQSRRSYPMMKHARRRNLEYNGHSARDIDQQRRIRIFQKIDQEFH